MVGLAQRGDEAAFEWLYTRYSGAIHIYLYRLMNDSTDAEDLTADTFLKAWLHLPKTSDDLRFGAWIYRVATNVALDLLRHRGLIRWQPWAAFLACFHPAQVAPEGHDSPERAYLSTEASAEIEQVMASLPPKYRLCLLLREYQGLSYDEIAEVLSTTRAAVKSLLFRAREEFRQHPLTRRLRTEHGYA
jgi:RNA polymerase sigma-70 factor (ECF subfamily)